MIIVYNYKLVVTQGALIRHADKCACHHTIYKFHPHNSSYHQMNCEEWWWVGWN